MILLLLSGENGRKKCRDPKYAEAEPFHQRALRIREHQAGPEDPLVAASLNGLALLYQAQGKYTEAEPLFKRALHIQEQQLGPEHPETAEVQHDFAGFQLAQGKSLEAAVLYQRALMTREHVFGPDHPMTTDTYERLHTVLVALERVEEAAMERSQPEP